MREKKRHEMRRYRKKIAERKKEDAILEKKRNERRYRKMIAKERKKDGNQRTDARITRREQPKKQLAVKRTQMWRMRIKLKQSNKGSQNKQILQRKDENLGIQKTTKQLLLKKVNQAHQYHHFHHVGQNTGH